MRKTAVISGSMGTVGRSLANKLNKEGFALALLYHSPLSEETKKFISSLGPGHATFSCDVTNEKEMIKTAEKIKKLFGSIDVCIHAAVGRIIRKNISDLSFTDLERELAVSFYGGFHFLKNFSPLVKDKGIVIGLTSNSIEGSGEPRMAGYNIGKTALRALLKEFQRDVLPRGIRIYALAPGFMDTSLNADLPRKVIEFAIHRSPSTKLTQPDDVASAILDLIKNHHTFGLSFTVPLDNGTPL